MAPPKRNSRRITVAGRLYRWYYHHDEYEPCWASVSVRLEDNLNGSVVSARALYDGTVGPSAIRRVIDIALGNAWEPDADKNSSMTLSDFDSTCCFFGFPKLFTHQGNQYLCTLAERAGLHMKIQLADNPKSQKLATYCTLEFEQCTEQLAALFVDSAIALGWQPSHASPDVFWLQSDACAKVVSSLPDSTRRGRTA